MALSPQIEVSPKPEWPCVDHLLLLVGSNPLPNAVAALLLTCPGGKVHLLYSDATADTADRLCAWLVNARGLDVALVGPVAEADPCNVASVVSAWVDGLGGVDQRCGTATIGLHYTGGTKVMAVQSDRTLSGRLAHTSYLDSQTRVLYVDAADPDGDDKDTVIPVGQAVDLSLDDIGSLHGLAQLAWLPVVPSGNRYLQPVWDALDELGIPATRRGCVVRTSPTATARRTVCDVAAVVGYQLFAFVCPQGNRDHANLKIELFACIERARRIGGDEARAALVCPVGHGSPTLLEEEMVSNFNELKQAFGIHPYKAFANDENLKDSIKAWISGEVNRGDL